MPLHRLTVPSYTGGLPGTHDYINDPASNGDPGTSTPMDSKKSSGVNQGTYFVAFSEAATASNTNRGLKALAQNTDFLDDAIHRDVAQPAVSASATPGSPLASFVLTGAIFVGAPGVTNDQRTRSGMVSLVDGNGQPLIVLSGGVWVGVKVSLIQDGIGNNVLGNNFYVNPTINVSPSIPSGQSYRVVYFTRSNLLSMDQGVLSKFNEGLSGDEDRWAFVKTLDLTVPKLASNNTFVGKQILSFPVVDQPALSDTTYAALRVQTWESQVNNSPNVFMRKYTRGASATQGDPQGFEITINARWDATGGNWVPDTTTQPAFKFVLAQAAISGAYINDAIRKYVLRAPTSTFSDSAFFDRYTFYENGVTARHGDAATYFLSLNDDLTGPYLQNHYKPILGTIGGALGSLCMLATERGTAASTDDNGVVFTYNARWDSPTQLWVANNTSGPSTKLLFGPNGLKLSRKASVASPFGDTTWDNNVTLTPSNSSPGDLEYKVGVGRGKLINIYKGVSGDDGGGVWYVGGSVVVAGLICEKNSAWVFFPVDVPQGSTITRLRFAVNVGAASDNMSFVFGYRGPMSFSLAPLTPPTNNTISTVNTTASGPAIYSMTLSETVTDPVLKQYYVAVQSTVSASTNLDMLYGIQILFTDVSPAGR